MVEREALVRLCSLCGISTEYADIWGNRRMVSEQTLRSLCGAMGIPSGSDAEVRQSIDEFETRAWRRLLPPVQVVREQAMPFNIVVTIPAERENHSYQWRLTLESGEWFEGTFQPKALQAVEQRDVDGETFLRRVFPLTIIPPIGYHRFTLDGAAMSLIVTPSSCYQPAALQGNGRVWGPSVQLYGLRSRRNWGIGDFVDLKNLVEFCGEQGAGVLGVNPLHALFPRNPEHAVPYCPSSRLFLNVLYLNVESIADFAECDDAREEVAAPRFQAELRSLRAEDLVRYSRVAAAKFPVLDRLYRHFRTTHLDSGSVRGAQFRAFQSEGGESLRRQALFETLQADFRSRDSSMWGWPLWPEPYRNPASPEVTAFYAENRERVEFYEYLQWQAELQLHDAGHLSEGLGLGVGLLLDLAVGVSRGGAETWADQALYAMNASIGAPPDDFNLHGQDWGLPPMIPLHLTETAYAPFISTLRECMGPAGALRVDHVMGLMRQFWVPAGGSPADGAYVSYPLSDLLGILALESRRNHCLVVGEDLGTVPDLLRDALTTYGVLSYRLMYFEKDASGAFKSPADYPAHALAAVTTHDLATLAGYWKGTDLDVRGRLGLYPTEAQREAQTADRLHERSRLLRALEREHLLPPGAASPPDLTPDLTHEHIQAVHAYLARSPAKLMLVQLEDVFGQLEQVNLPGTAEETYMSWRRKLPLDLDEWQSDPRVIMMMETLRRERGVSSQAASEAA